MEVNLKLSPKEDCIKFKSSLNSVKLQKNYEIEQTNYFKWSSCNNLNNFVPKILPKKSFCKPSLLVLNPEIIQKHNSEEIGKNNSKQKSEDDNSLELSLESSNDEEVKNNDAQKNLEDEKEKSIVNSKENFYLEKKFNFIFEGNKYKSGECVTILDILSMNYK